MRVLIVPYPGTLDVVGGHLTQQFETVEALRRAGACARIAAVEEAAEADADIVHFFGDVRPLLDAGRPSSRLVVSPIYFPRSFVLGPHYRRPGLSHMSVKRVRGVAARFRRPRARSRLRRDVTAALRALAEADRIVVNSHAEGRLLQRDVRSLPELHVARSGVAERAFHGDAFRGRKMVGLGDEPFVLSVARVEPRKNLLAVALAMRALPYRYVVVGAVLPGNESYLDSIRYALPSVVHLPHLDHGELQHVYAAATVHALPSWYETTGLSSLEALAGGTPAVVSGGPCVREYFGEHASFCRPGSVGSVRRAIHEAAASRGSGQQQFARRFSWDATAQQLIAAYES